MVNAFYLLILLASLAVWQSGGDDACGSVECLPSSESVCALHEQTGSVALFADECVLRCTSCRMGTEFKKVNSSLCSASSRYITVCPDFALNKDKEETKSEGSGDGIVVVQVDIGPEGSGDYDGAGPLFSQSPPLPLPLLPMGSELLRRLVMASQPEPPPDGLTLVSADFKVDVTINLPPPPPPPLMALLRLPLPVPPPPPPHFQALHYPYQPQQREVSSAALPTTRPYLPAAVAALVAVIVAAVHI